MVSSRLTASTKMQDVHKKCWL